MILNPGGAQKTPEISVSSSGLITATAGNKSATKQLSSSMDSDFVASNIKSCVSIFGVSGSYAPSGEVELLSLVDGGFYGDQNITLVRSPSQSNNDYYDITITTQKNIKEFLGLSAVLTYDPSGSDYEVKLSLTASYWSGFDVTVIGWFYDDSVYERGSNTGIIETDQGAASANLAFSGNTISISELASDVLGEFYLTIGELPDFTDGVWSIKGIVSYIPSD